MLAHGEASLRMARPRVLRRAAHRDDVVGRAPGAVHLGVVGVAGLELHGVARAGREGGQHAVRDDDLVLFVLCLELQHSTDDRRSATRHNRRCGELHAGSGSCMQVRVK